jgi:hypothetical protein
MRGLGGFPLVGQAVAVDLARIFAPRFLASMSFSPSAGGAPAENSFWMPALQRLPLRAAFRINVAETAKVSLDMTAAAVEATPHSSPSGQ